MKSGIQAGFAFLKEKEFNQALNCFKKRLKTAKTPQEINACLIGKAHAQIGLKNYGVAIKILEDLFISAPYWEVPYVTLARMYEDRNMVKEAESTFLRAINVKKERSRKFYECYEWFLTHRMLPYIQQMQQPPQQLQQPLQQQNIFSPSLGIHQQRYRASSKPLDSRQQQASRKQSANKR